MNKSRYADHLDFLVHGIGLVSHELPRLTNRTRDPYKPEDARLPLELRMVLSVETTLQHPRRGFIKLEDTVAVTETGHEVFGDRAHGWNCGGRQRVTAVATILLSSTERIMGGLFKTALAGWWNDRAMSLGAAIAFFTVFSLAPMLLVAIAVAGACVQPRGGAGRYRRGARRTCRRPDRCCARGHDRERRAFRFRGGWSGARGRNLPVSRYRRDHRAPGDHLDIVWKVKPPETYGIGAFVRTRLLSLALMSASAFC